MTACFFSYPAKPNEIASTIDYALQILSEDMRVKDYRGWKESDIAGRFITDPILANINNCSLLAADITQLNFNVTYEIGYAIGKSRRIFLTRNTAYKTDESLIREVGIFDTLGYKQYQQAKELAILISKVSDVKPLDFSAASVNKKAPIYILLPKTRTDLEVHLLSQVKKSRLRFRSFDPEEAGRLSSQDAIRNIAASYGVIVPLIPCIRRDAQVHNLRAAFVAGLATGMGREILLLQFGDDPVPIDYRDFVKHIGKAAQIDSYIAEFAPMITGLLQSDIPRVVSQTKSLLENLNLGASAAENEMGDLSEYYLETDEYRKVSQGEAQIVAGRKGSGKTALFFRVRDKYRPGNSNVVLDLRPESFQLRKFKDVILHYLQQGTKEHTITAFWEYLMILEICHKILANDKMDHFSDNRIYQPYRELEEAYQVDQFDSEGDFAERMLNLTDRILEEFAGKLDNDQKIRLSNAELTNILYKHDTRKLREKVSAYLKHKNSVWIFMDNLDKGWTPMGLDKEDVLILRCLVEAMSKLEKGFRKVEVVCHCVLFLRNDVYELLVDHTTDRGKTSRVVLDWTDPELLRELLRRRLISNGALQSEQFDGMWRQICVSHVGSEESSSYLIDRCLMRPRSLLELVYACRSHAVNLGHRRIEIEDIRQGELVYSSDLVENVGLEMRDVFPGVAPDIKNVLYEFIGASVRLSVEEIVKAFNAFGITESGMHDSLLDMMLWWGFFGIVKPDGEIAYIYTVRYHMDRLKAQIRKSEESTVYYINPAFWAGLEIQV